MLALIEGAILAVLVVFLFLQDIRATVISAVAIPLSAIPAFWFMGMIGINLNFLSLLALALVAGVLVDDAIVEIENIVRHMRMGKSGYQASIDAADEIGLAVLATTMAIVAVFLPVALMPGISGQFFYHFGFTVVLSVMMSLLVARMITPLMAAYFLRAHGVEQHASGKWMTRYLDLLEMDDRRQDRQFGPRRDSACADAHCLYPGGNRHPGRDLRDRSDRRDGDDDIARQDRRARPAHQPARGRCAGRRGSAVLALPRFGCSRG